MIRIEIFDIGKEDKRTLSKLGRFLMEMAGDVLVAAPSNDEKIKDVAEVGRICAGVDPITHRPGFLIKLSSGWKWFNTEIEAKAYYDSIFKEALTITKEQKIEIMDKVLTEEINDQLNLSDVIEGTREIPIDGATLMNKLTKYTAEKKITTAQILQIVKNHGLTRAADLLQRSDLLETVDREIEALL